MSGDLVLLTGATGLVGFAVLLELLNQKYKVRLAVRSESKIDAIKSALPSKYTPDELEFTTVPDMAVEHAFDSALKGVKYVLHVAAPIPKPSDDYETTMIKPSIDTTLSVLHSALQAPDIKKVVITSSVAAVLPSEPGVFSAENVEPNPAGPFDHPFWAYVASKKMALNATRGLIADKSPHFDIINVMPAFVVGPNGFAKGKAEFVAGSNAIALAPLLDFQFPEPRPGFVCHVDDVALVHVDALGDKVKGHHDFGVVFDGPNTIEWNDAAEIVKRRLPDLVEKGIFPLEGGTETQQLPFKFEASKTEQVLGFRFKSFEDMVVDLANAYAKIVSRAS